MNYHQHTGGAWSLAAFNYIPGWPDMHIILCTINCHTKKQGSFLLIPHHREAQNLTPPPHRSELVSDWLKFTRAWVKTLRRLLFRISIMVWRDLNQWGNQQKRSNNRSLFRYLPPPQPYWQNYYSPPPSWCSAEQYGSSFCLIKYCKYLFVYFN